MNPKDKTSFIPKKPVTSQKSGNESAGQSILFIASFIIFILTLAAAGGVYFYEDYLGNLLQQKKQYLEESKDAFEPALIRELKTLDKRMTAANQLLGEHLAPSVIFSILEKNTLKTVSFSEMSYSFTDGSPKIMMSGEATDFNSIALQSEIFGGKDLFKSPVFSGLNINDKGRVAFSFSSSLSTEEILYKTNLNSGLYGQEGINSEAQTPTATSTNSFQKNSNQ